MHSTVQLSSGSEIYKEGVLTEIVVVLVPECRHLLVAGERGIEGAVGRLASIIEYAEGLRGQYG